MRHTERDHRPATVTPEQVASHNCAAQSELTPTGCQHTEQIGAAIRALHLPIAAVHTGRLCRTQTTGQLLNIAPVTDDDRLDASSTWVNRGGAPAEQRATAQVLLEPPPAGTDIVLVSSALDIPHPQPAVLYTTSAPAKPPCSAPAQPRKHRYWHGSANQPGPHCYRRRPPSPQLQLQLDDDATNHARRSGLTSHSRAHP